MDIALIEDPEDEVDDDERGEDQHRHRRERILEGLGITLESRVDGARQVQLGLGPLDRIRRLTERRALRQVEADGDRGELALMADR